jgi:hypothetical protein
MTSTFEGFPARMKKIDTGLLESVTEVIDRLSGVEVSDIIESIQINDNGIDLGQMNKALLTRTLKERGYDKEVVNRVVSEATSTRMILDGMKSLISKYGEKVSKKPSKKEEAKTVIEEKITVETIGEDHSEDVLHTDSKGNKITRGVPEIDYSVKSVEPEIPKNPIEKALKRGIVNPDDVIEHKRGWSEQFILTEDGITRVSGKSVELEGAPNYDFFLFKRSDGLYSITEKSTGLSLAKGKSQAGTKTIAENVLTQHRDRIDQTISDTPKIEVVQNKKIVQSVEPTPEKLEKDIKEENIGDGYPTTVSMRLADIVRSITPKDPDFEKFVINIEKALKRGIEARDFDSMIESVKELSEKDLNDTQWRELRKYYNVQTSSEPVNQGLVFKKVVGYEGKGRKKKPIYKYIIEDRGVVDHRNRRIIKTRPFSMFDNVTGGWKRAHQVVEIKNGEKTVTMNIFDSKDLRNDIGTMIEAEHKNGYYYHSGVKDHDTFMFLPYQVEVSEIKDGMSRMHKLFGAASKKDIDNDYQVWKRVYFDELPKGVNEKQLREMYDRSYLSNVKVYEGLNKKSLEDMLDANAKAKKADIGQQTSEVEVEVTNEKYSRNSLDNDSSSMYLFTDNAERTSRPTASSPNITEGWYAEKYKDKTNKPLHYGSTSNPTSAVIRGKNNAYPISTMSAYGTNWTNENFDLFKDTIDDEIGQIKQDLSKFKTLKLGDFRIGQGGRFAKLPSQHQSYLDSKLLELGIDNAGNSPKVSKPTQQTSEVEKKLKKLVNDYLTLWMFRISIIECNYMMQVKELLILKCIKQSLVKFLTQL